MARIRTIKPEFWTDRKLARTATRDQRLFYIGLWNHSDDEGRFIACARHLLGNIFPHDDDIHEQFIEDSLRDHADAGRLVLYEVDGERYGQCLNFGDHQRINRPSPSRIPAPPNDLQNPHGRLSEGSVRAHDGKGNREGEMERERDARAREVDAYTLAAVRGLYGWAGCEGTDMRIWNGQDSDDRDRLLTIACARLAAEGRQYSGRFFRAILESVIAEDKTEKTDLLAWFEGD